MSHPAASSTFLRDFDPLRCSRRCLIAWVAAWIAGVVPSVALAANFSVAPLNLAFGSVPTGASSSIPVTVTNISGVAQTPNFSGGAPNDPVNFGGSQNCAGLTLPPAGTCTFTYVFTPTTLGVKSSGTTIGIDAENFAITLVGTGISPVTVVPVNLVFGNVAVGASASIPVTVTNTSGVPQTPNYSGGAPNDPVNFGGSQNCAGITLPPGGSCAFTYVFTPTTLGPKSSSTTIGINAENFAITLAGTGVSPVSVAPVNLDFGNVAVGASASIPVTVTNTSGVPQTPNYSGGAPNDPVNFGGSQNCAGITLPPAGTCTFTYVFTPTTLGPKSSNTTIGINAENFAITLAGTGVSPVSVAPVNLDFGNVAVGASASIPVTVTNTSGVPQTPNYAGGAPIDSVNFDASQNCAGITLAPGGTCTFTYVFHPTTPGVKSSSTTITIDGANFAITLAGIGFSPIVVPVPAIPAASLIGLAAGVGVLGLLLLGRLRRRPT